MLRLNSLLLYWDQDFHCDPCLPLVHTDSSRQSSNVRCGILQKLDKGTGGCTPDWRMSSSILLMLRHARIYFWKSESYRFCLYWPLFRSIIKAFRLLQIPRFRRNLPDPGEASMPFPISSVSDGDSPNRVAAPASNRKFQKVRPPMVV